MSYSFAEIFLLSLFFEVHTSLLIFKVCLGCRRESSCVSSAAGQELYDQLRIANLQYFSTAYQFSRKCASVCSTGFSSVCFVS